MSISGVRVSALAWLFVRGEESVRLDVSQDADGFQLTVEGPGTLRRTLHVADVTTLLVRQSEIEAELTAVGYALNHFTTDRRLRPR